MNTPDVKEIAEAIKTLTNGIEEGAVVFYAKKGVGRGISVEIPGENPEGFLMTDVMGALFDPEDSEEQIQAKLEAVLATLVELEELK